MLVPDKMTKVLYTDRENTFKGVVGSDKWTPGLKKAQASAQAATQGPSAAAAAAPPPADDDSSSNDEDDAAPTGEAVAAVQDTEALVPYFVMEHHPKVCSWN